MKYLDWIILFLCILCIITVIHVYGKPKKDVAIKPKTLISTIRNKSTIPEYIFENRNKFAKNYDHIIFDDKECVEFLEKYYGKQFSNKFKEIKNGAHKADLFRYAYLYKYGGLYVDIKTIFIKNVNEIFTDQNLTYFIFTKNNNTFYNGIIYTPPKNPIIYEMLLKSVEIQPFHEYYFNLKCGSKIIGNNILSSRIQQGLNLTDDYIPNIMILYEEFFDKSYCNNKTDRYGFCTFVVDEGNKPIIKIRDHEYSPNYI